MPSVMGLGHTLTQGVKNQFAASYEPLYQNIEAELRDIIWFDAPSDKISELYAQFDTAPYPRRWDPGTPIPSSAMGGRQFRVQNRDFGFRIYLPKNWEDDQTGYAMAMARDTGSHWATLAERIFFEVIIGTASLLPTTVSSADGNALYLTTTRYGSSGGNVVTVTGTSTVQQIITDYYGVVRRFTEFQDTQGQPYFNHTYGGLKVVVGSSLTLVWRQALKQIIVPLDASTATSNAGVSNTIMAANDEPELVISQRITDTKQYYFKKGLPVDRRPLIRQIRKAQVEHIGNYETSDHTRDTGEPYLQWDSREGWGSALAIGTVRVS